MIEYKQYIRLQCGDTYSNEHPSICLDPRKFAGIRCPHCGSDNVQVIIDRITNDPNRTRSIYRCMDCYSADYLSNAKNISEDDDKNISEEDADKQAECKSCAEPSKEYFIDECKSLNEENYKLRKLVRILLEKVE